MKIWIAALLILALPVHAQVYKFTINGKVEYRNAPCPAGAKAALTDIQSAPTSERSRRSSEEHPDARALTALVAEAVTAKDYRRASNLAVTAEHHRMIREAQDADASAKAAARPPSLKS